MLTDAVLRHGETTPDAVALIDDHGCSSFAQLGRDIRRFASWLSGLCRPGDTVGIWVGNRREHLVVMLAAPLAGVVAVPMDAMWTGREAEECLERFGVVALVVDGGSQLDRLEGGTRDRLRGRTLSVDPCEGVMRFVDAVATSASPSTSQPTVPESVVCISLTSGTGGRLKAVTLTERVMAGRLMVQLAEFGFTAADRYYAATPIHYGAGRAYPLAHLVVGGSVELAGRFDAKVAGDRLASGELSTSFLVPTQIRRVLEEFDQSDRKARLRVLISSGASLDPLTRARIRSRLTGGLFEVYGGTEPGSVAVLLPGEQEGHADTVGRPVWNGEVRVVDAAGDVVSPGSSGEVLVRGDAVFPGYFRDPVATAEAFTDGWYRTGDIGSLGEDGFLRLHGRTKEMVITGGRNVFPAEVESVARRHAGVADVAVVGVPDDQWGEVLVAYVVPEDGACIDLAGFLDTCRQGLAPYKVPKIVRFLTEVPRTPAGKVDARRLAKSGEGQA